VPKLTALVESWRQTAELGTVTSAWTVPESLFALGDGEASAGVYVIVAEPDALVEETTGVPPFPRKLDPPPPPPEPWEPASSNPPPPPPPPPN
jgi:hypothetical protein